MDERVARAPPRAGADVAQHMDQHAEMVKVRFYAFLDEYVAMRCPTCWRQPAAACCSYGRGRARAAAALLLLLTARSLFAIAPSLLATCCPPLTSPFSQNQPHQSRRFQSVVEEEGAEMSQRLMKDYHAQVVHMKQNDTTTLYVDMSHVMQHDIMLFDAIECEFSRCEPFLREATRNFVRAQDPEYVLAGDRGEKEFFTSFYNMRAVSKIRDLRTDKIGRLTSITGTVTRTSERHERGATRRQ